MKIVTTDGEVLGSTTNGTGRYIVTLPKSEYDTLSTILEVYDEHDDSVIYVNPSIELLDDLMNIDQNIIDSVYQTVSYAAYIDEGNKVLMKMLKYNTTVVIGPQDLCDRLMVGKVFKCTLPDVPGTIDASGLNSETIESDKSLYHVLVVIVSEETYVSDTLNRVIHDTTLKQLTKEAYALIVDNSHGIIKLRKDVFDRLVEISMSQLDFTKLRHDARVSYEDLYEDALIFTDRFRQERNRPDMFREGLAIVSYILESMLRLEASLFERTLSKIATNYIPEDQYGHVYKNIAGEFLINFDMTSNVGNTYLFPLVFKNDIFDEGLFDADKMFPERHRAIRQKMKEEADMRKSYVPEFSVNTRCKQCKNMTVTSFDVQTRSSDEPSTTFYTCHTCGNNWSKNG